MKYVAIIFAIVILSTTLILNRGERVKEKEMPKIGETLANGARFTALKRDYTDTVTLKIFVRGGIFRESAEKNGVGALSARVWTKSGTFLESVEFVGGSISAGMGGDFLDFSFSVPSSYLERLLPELKTHLLAPSFDENIFKIEKDLTLREIEAEKDDPSSVAFKAFLKATYKTHPYALETEGDTSTVSALTFEDVKRYHEENFAASDMTAVLVGNFTPEEEREIKSVIARVNTLTRVHIACEDAKIAETSKSEVSDTRIQQSKFFLAYAAPAANHKDYVKTKLLAEYLGGSMSSPYFNTLRKEKGYAYSVNTMYPSRICTSRFIGYIGLAPENVEDAESTMKRLNREAVRSITAGELEKVKNHIIGQVLQEAETNSRLAWYAAFFETLGLGAGYMDTYVKEIQGVTKEDLAKAAEIFNNTPSTTFLYSVAK